MANIPTFWRQHNIASYLLLPLSWLFARLIKWRKRCIKPERLPVKIVVVGNISIGGNGKTPIVIALVKALQAKGITVGVVSRGYGGNAKIVTEVCTRTSATLVGDEPKLIWQQTGCPVVVGKKRCDAVKLLRRRYPHLEWIVSDDGLQHYKMPRDLELCVVAPDFMLGNGLLFPAGPLREPLSRLRHVDVVLYSGKPQKLLDVKSKQLILQMKNEEFSHFNGDKITLDTLKHSPCIALTAIARPERFFSRLESLGLVLTEKKAFSDHANLPSNIAKDIASNTFIIITGKDAVKLDDWSSEKRQQCVILNYEAILPKKLVDQLFTAQQTTSRSHSIRS